MAKKDYYAQYKNSTTGKIRMSKSSAEEGDAYDAMVKQSEGHKSFVAMDSNTRYNAPDIYEKQELSSYNTKLDEIASGKGKNYWAFMPTAASLGAKHVNDIQYQAVAQYTNTGQFSEFSKALVGHYPNAPGPKWMSASESDIQNKIVTQQRDIFQTNVNTRAQEASNRQTQANVSESEGGGTGRGSSTRRKEKRGGRASTLLAGNLGGSRANTASKALLGG